MTAFLKLILHKPGLQISLNKSTNKISKVMDRSRTCLFTNFAFQKNCIISNGGINIFHWTTYHKFIKSKKYKLMLLYVRYLNRADPVLQVRNQLFLQFCILCRDKRIFHEHIEVFNISYGKVQYLFCDISISKHKKRSFFFFNIKMRAEQ
ncbi:unnamed protein product [Cuscuta epithymum]|uniref:Uncharacterized protein n=1 Tax=Cuscuta epithymum TaxID=186058 RepID=A0AAV0CVY5_9ASTE|nr:unnamed protein product [Cuscuta epithymum]CAH9144346.1 unnamed protein product [Cuscuta epithymum]